LSLCWHFPQKIQSVFIRVFFRPYPLPPRHRAIQVFSSRRADLLPLPSPFDPVIPLPYECPWLDCLNPPSPPLCSLSSRTFFPPRTPALDLASRLLKNIVFAIEPPAHLSRFFSRCAPLASTGHRGFGPPPPGTVILWSNFWFVRRSF